MATQLRLPESWIWETILGIDDPATLALLRQAVEEAHRRGLRDSCPVCDQESAGLAATMARRIEEQGTDSIAKRLVPLEAREARVKAQLAELSRLRSEVRAAESERAGEYDHALSLHRPMSCLKRLLTFRPTAATPSRARLHRCDGNRRGM